MGRRLSPEAALAFAWHLAAALAELHERGHAHGALHPSAIGLDERGRLVILRSDQRAPDPDPTAGGQARDCYQLAACLEALGLERLDEPSMLLVLSGLRRSKARIRLSPGRGVRQALTAVLARRPSAEAELVAALGPAWQLDPRSPAWYPSSAPDQPWAPRTPPLATPAMLRDLRPSPRPVPPLVEAPEPPPWVGPAEAPSARPAPVLRVLTQKLRPPPILPAEPEPIGPRDAAPLPEDEPDTDPDLEGEGEIIDIEVDEPPLPAATIIERAATVLHDPAQALEEDPPPPPEEPAPAEATPAIEPPPPPEPAPEPEAEPEVERAPEPEPEVEPEVEPEPALPADVEGPEVVILADNDESPAIVDLMDEPEELELQPAPAPALRFHPDDAPPEPAALAPVEEPVSPPIALPAPAASPPPPPSPPTPSAPPTHEALTRSDPAHDAPKWGDVRGVSSGGTREAELGLGKWTESARPLGEVARALPGDGTRPLDLEPPPGGGAALVVGLIVAALLLVALAIWLF